MPATLLPVPRARFFNTAGLPLVGGKVYTYAAGTSTPLSSYTDYNGTIANANPVILDSAGEANIWLANQLYKVVLKDASDVTLWTVDNVGQNSVAALAAGFGIATNIASAATVDLGTLSSHFANITGTTTITSFGSTATLDAPVYLIKFAGALTLTNSGSLISPTGANITTAINDRAWVEYIGSGAWRIMDYMKADGTPLSFDTVAGKLSLTNDISPAQLTANTDDWAPTGFSTCYGIRLSTDASRNLTGIAAGTDGRLITLMNVGSFPLVLKHDVTSTAANRILCPSNLDYVLQANSSTIIQYDATSSRWRVLAGALSINSGQVIQTVYAETTSVINCATVTPNDDTIPQVSETQNVLSVTITPRYSTSLLRIRGVCSGTSGTTSGGMLVSSHLFRDAGVNSIASNTTYVSQASANITAQITKTISASSTAATTLYFNIGVNASGWWVNGNNAGSRLFGGVGVASLIVEEISV